MNGNVLTSSADYTALVTKANNAIEAFIKQNPSHVKYETNEDGFTYITLEYGSLRNSELKQIAETCNTTTNDEDFKIGDIRCSIIYASNLILKFKGKTTEVIADLQDSEKTSGLDLLVTKSKVNVTIPVTLVSDLVSFINNFVSNKSQYTQIFLEKSGLSFYEFGDKGHIGINIDKLISVPAMNETKTKIIMPILSLLEQNPKLITTELAKKLAEKDLYLERVNQKSIMVGYKLKLYDKEDPNDYDEFYYKKTPGKITRVFVHIGYGTVTETSDNFELYTDVDGAKRVSKNSIYQMTDVRETIVIPVEITNESTGSELRNAICNNAKFKNKICSGLYQSTDGYTYNIEDYDAEDVESGLWIADSSLKTSQGQSGQNSNLFDTRDVIGNIASFIADNASVTSDNASSLYDGYSIIEKALKTGRALDVIIPLDDGTFYSHIIEYNPSEEKDDEPVSEVEY